MKKVYTHVGKRFSKEKFERIENRTFPANKPFGGFWLSINGSWEDWCKLEMPHWLKEEVEEYAIEGNFFYITKTEDVDKLPVFEKDYEKGIDFEKLSEKYDGVIFLLSRCPELYYKLYGWDIDSVLIFNPDSLKEVHKEVHYDNENGD